MAPMNKKTKDVRPWREQSLDMRLSRRSHRKRDTTANNSQRTWLEHPVPKLLCDLLGFTKYNKALTRDRSESFESSRKKQRRTRRYPVRNDREGEYETRSARSSRSLDSSEQDGVESETTSVESRAEPLDAENSSAATSSVYECDPTNWTKSQKKKSFERIIDNYVTAAVEEGKRQARKYIRQALFFGLNSGYLVPGDSKGKVLHVSTSLARSNSRRASRERRRRVRQGETDEEPIDRRALRRATEARRDRSHSDASDNQTVPRRKKRGRKNNQNPKSSRQELKKPNTASSSNIKNTTKSRTTRNSNKNEKETHKIQLRQRRSRGTRVDFMRTDQNENDDADQREKNSKGDSEYNRDLADKRNQSPRRISKDNSDAVISKNAMECQESPLIDRLVPSRIEEHADLQKNSGQEDSNFLIPNREEQNDGMPTRENPPTYLL